MVAAGLVGFGWLHKLATDENLRLPIIHHPAYSGGFVSPGVSGVADYLQLGLLPRIFGADMPIFRILWWTLYFYRGTMQEDFLLH